VVVALLVFAFPLQNEVSIYSGLAAGSEFVSRAGHLKQVILPARRQPAVHMAYQGFAQRKGRQKVPLLARLNCLRTL
jgi:hypothetical protein